MMTVKKETLLLISVISIGFILRVWGIDFGLPHQFHQDEPIIVNHALAYGAGDLNPHFFIVPPLTSYILFFCYGIYYVLLSLLGAIKGTEAFAISFFKDPTPFYLIGRFVAGIIPSLISVYLTYKLASKYFSRRAAVYASCVVSLAFLNVVNGHYIYTDNLLVMFILASYLMLANLTRTPARRYYCLAAVFTGIAIATKYTAGLLIVPFFIAHITGANRQGMKRAGLNLNVFIFMIIMTLSFIICNPFSLCDWRFFILSISERIGGSYQGVTHHISHSLFEGLGSIAVILAILGLAITLVKRFREGLFIVSFPFVFYLHLILESQLYSRYALTVIPFLSVGLGFLVFDYLYPKMKSKGLQLMIVATSIIIIMPTFIKSVKADMLFARKDTRTEAAEWIMDNLPAGARVAFDNSSFKPQIKQTMAQLEEKRVILDKQPELKQLKSRKLDLQIKALEGEVAYEVYYLSEGDETAGQFLSIWPVIGPTLGELKKYRIEYAVFNNMTKSEEISRLRLEIAKRYKPAAVFSPYKEDSFRRPYDEVETTCLPIKTKELFSRTRPGPSIIIYRLDRKV